MRISVTTHQPWDVDADVLAVAVASDRDPDSAMSELDRRLDGALAAMRLLGEQTGEAFSGTVVKARVMGVDWILAMGVGDLDGFDRLAALRFGAAIERRLGGLAVKRLAVWLPAALAGHNELDERVLGELVARGVVEGAYEPAAIYRSEIKDAPPVLDELILVVPGGDQAAITEAADRGRIIGEGAGRARTLAQRASNDVSPEVLADEATAIANAHDLAIEIIGPEQATEMGMGMFMAVGRGSDNPPRLIVIRSGGARATDGRGRLLAMVGKGVTFDSGGISIKPAARMEEMKMDKAGACTVISAIATVATLRPGLPLMAVAPAVENMPGPHSTRPGDVVRALNGKVVEIENTDAEGRLILGDALVYAERQGATHLVDVATLTGAVERAFGKLVTGGFGTPQEWWDEVVEAGARQAERYVQIPLIADYKVGMESWYADFKNTGTADGSLVRSGLFLNEFVTRPWAHLDIGGTGYLRDATAWAARGATGVTHATLVELALRGT
ncbi:MAG: leucyl aminopeptidase family protein [Candidatus Limnocylindrales bacterium]